MALLRLLCKLNIIFCCYSDVLQCTALTSSPVAKRVTYPGQNSYNASLASYFDGKSRLTPNCIVQPTTAEEVSTIVKVLVAANLQKTCQFAVRSGGHTPIPGANNIEEIGRAHV